jgi:hypothetical protein
LVGSFLGWKIDNHWKVKLGVDPWIGGMEVYNLSDELRRNLENKGCLYLIYACHPDDGNVWIVGWKIKVDLYLYGR